MAISNRKTILSSSKTAKDHETPELRPSAPGRKGDRGLLVDVSVDDVIKLNYAVTALDKLGDLLGRSSEEEERKLSHLIEPHMEALRWVSRNIIEAQGGATNLLNANEGRNGAAGVEKSRSNPRQDRPAGWHD